MSACGIGPCLLSQLANIEKEPACKEFVFYKKMNDSLAYAKQKKTMIILLGFIILTRNRFDVPGHLFGSLNRVKLHKCEYKALVVRMLHCYYHSDCLFVLKSNLKHAVV